MDDQKTRVALVTGASSGIGRAVARRLLRDGWSVHVVGRRGDRLAEVVGAVPHALDVADGAAVAAAVGAMPPLDVVVHCAGGARGAGPVVDADLDAWEWMWRTNVTGTVNVVRAAVPRMAAAGRGTVVVVTSVAAFEALDGSAGYSSSKFGQSAITQTLRRELLASSVRVIEICPGVVQTEFFGQRWPDDEARARRIFDGIDPLDPDDVASTITFAIDQPDHVTIERLVVRPTAQGPHGRFHRA